MNKLRLTFEKGEATRYVGHLDVLRTFIRALRRAEIPVKYSEGFNPHAVMTFALPLGVGVTSECEIVDIAVTGAVPAEDVVNRLNQNLQEDGIRVTKCEYTEKPFDEIVKAEYIITMVTEERANVDDIKKTLASSEIMIDKKSKKKTKEINIMEHIFESEIIAADDDKVVLRVIVSAGNTFNIKPQLVAAAIEGATPSLRIKSIAPHRVRFIFDK